MELILWRHADAEDGADDMARRLTPAGEEQAAAMAQWLRAHLPAQYTLLASPAVRAQQTAAALGVKGNMLAVWRPDWSTTAPRIVRQARYVAAIHSHGIQITVTVAVRKKGD